MSLFKKTLNIPAHTQGSLQDAGEPTDAPGERRVIRTARTLEAINEAAESGLRPLVKSVKPNPEVRCWFAVFQNLKTGEIKVVGDRRFRPDDRYLKVIEFTDYYPYHFPNPFAAYLIPPDLAVGEIVWLEDVIEDIVAVWGNQGYQPRLEAGPARWTGTEFDILFDPQRDAQRWIG